MANTRKSTKRAKQAKTRQARNTMVRSATKSTLNKAIEAVKKQDPQAAKDAYQMAVKALRKAATKGALPKGRASRKISRLTLLAQKALPSVFTSSRTKSASAK